MPDHASSPATAAPNDPFEALYLALRRRLLLQCFAVTGDLSAARAGVREAFTAARQQWRRVGALEQPEAWIRQRAMNTAQRRHVPHRRRAEHGLSEQQNTVLRALNEIKDGERKALVLRYLGDLDLLAIGRDLSITERSAQQRVAHAEDSFARARGCDRSQIAEELRSLAPVVTHPGLPRAHAIYDRAYRRSRLQIILGVVTAVALATLGGLLVHPTPRSDALALINARPVTRAVLLTANQVDTALPGTSWTETGTSTNTAGSGLHDVCQRERFADPSAAGTWVREFRSANGGGTLVQRTEVSIGDATARQTYATTLNWYADCTQTRTQLASAARLKGVGDEAWLLTINAVGKPAQTYQVLVARSGMITNTAVLSLPTASVDKLTSAAKVAELGRLMTQNLCRTSAAEKCLPVTQAVATDAVPPVAENAGMLATVDLPLLPDVERPWVGTQPVRGGPNLAATTCDATTFSGATTRARTFLIPGAALPQSFGLTETIATYPTATAAANAATKIASLMTTCHKRQIGTRVNEQRGMAKNPLAPAVTMWHEEAQVNAHSQVVTFWMAVVQYGSTVAQITFIPATNANTTPSGFLAVAERAAQRLTQQ